MKIKKVEIKDYKAFYGLNEFKVEGKTFSSMGKTEAVKVPFFRP